jgi:hypothetical protein
MKSRRGNHEPTQDSTQQFVEPSDERLAATDQGHAGERRKSPHHTPPPAPPTPNDPASRGSRTAAPSDGADSFRPLVLPPPKSQDTELAGESAHHPPPPAPPTPNDPSLLSGLDARGKRMPILIASLIVVIVTGVVGALALTPAHKNRRVLPGSSRRQSHNPAETHAKTRQTPPRSQTPLRSQRPSPSNSPATAAGGASSAQSSHAAPTGTHSTSSGAALPGPQSGGGPPSQVGPQTIQSPQAPQSQKGGAP